MDYLIKHPKLLQFGTVLIVFFALCILVAPSETNFLWRLPSYLAGVPKILNNSVEFIMFEWLSISTYNAEIEDYETSALMIEITRSISRSVLFSIEFIREILVGGQKTIVAFTSWDWIGENERAVWPALPWTVVAGCGIALGYALKVWSRTRHSGSMRDRLSCIFRSMGASDGNALLRISCGTAISITRSFYWRFSL
ncbi:MAG: glycine betaine/proline transport system permease protein [Gammaproteobacteria bacterium]|jgi:glycine betaine/proline transport system permease protein